MSCENNSIGVLIFPTSKIGLWSISNHVYEQQPIYIGSMIHSETQTHTKTVSQIFFFI
jgi:hypothetical protein